MEHQEKINNCKRENLVSETTTNMCVFGTHGNFSIVAKTRVMKTGNKHYIHLLSFDLMYSKSISQTENIANELIKETSLN